MSAIAIDAKNLFLLYERDAERYCDSLPLEHFMESTTQSKQREITLESLALVQAQWPEFQVFSELLIQYPLPDEDIRKPERVVPDNMVVLHPEPIEARGSFMVPLQPVGPTLVLEYVSKHSKRKDYEDNRRKYGQELKVPYYLLFDPEKSHLELFHRVEEEYVAVEANSAGRLEILDLSLEVAIKDGWVRFWYHGDLLPLPGDLLNSLNAERLARVAERAAAEGRLEVERIAAERRLEAERIAAEGRLEAERQARLAAETEKQALGAELARLREMLAAAQKPQ